MKKGHLFIYGLLATAAMLAAACTQVQEPPKSLPSVPKPAPQPVVVNPDIKEIVGIAEWAPSAKGTLACIAENSYGGTLTYAWEANGGIITGDGRTATWTAPQAEGDYTITVKVTNDMGGQSSLSKVYKVVEHPFGSRPNDNTVYLRMNLSSNEVVKQSRRALASSITEIQCVVEEANNAVLSYSWSGQGGRFMGQGIAEGQASRVGWLAPGVAGPYTVSVKVTDKSGQAASGQVDFDVYFLDQ